MAGMERLNKFLAHAGVGSRRHCDGLITGGRVKIDGRRVTDLGLRVDPETQIVSVDDHPVRHERPAYWLVHKPPGYLCTNRDPAGRPLALDLIPHVDQRVFTVGRLDEASEGLLLMTNDGELADALTHPRYGVEKTYLVLVAGKPSAEDFRKMLDGVWLSDGKVRAKDVRRLKPQGDSTWVRVVLNEGKNREIRRMLAQLGHKVLKLRRVAIGPVQLDKLPKGKSRRLSLPELEALRHAVERAKMRVAKKVEQARTGVEGGPPAPPTGSARGAGGPPSGTTSARSGRPVGGRRGGPNGSPRHDGRPRRRRP